MSENTSNVDHLHEAGVLNKEELSEAHAKAINNLSAEEVEQLKAIHKSGNKGNDDPVGVAF